MIGGHHESFDASQADIQWRGGSAGAPWFCAASFLVDAGAWLVRMNVSIFRHGFLSLQSTSSVKAIVGARLRLGIHMSAWIDWIRKNSPDAVLLQECSSGSHRNVLLDCARLKVEKHHSALKVIRELNDDEIEILITTPAP